MMTCNSILFLCQLTFVFLSLQKKVSYKKLPHYLYTRAYVSYKSQIFFTLAGAAYLSDLTYLALFFAVFSCICFISWDSDLLSYGNKKRLFFLNFSTLGCALLVFFTSGLFMWAVPAFSLFFLYYDHKSNMKVFLDFCIDTEIIISKNESLVQSQNLKDF
jgi:hypothetical protein